MEKISPGKFDTVPRFLYQHFESHRGKVRFDSGEVRRRIQRQIDDGLPINFAVIAMAHKNPNNEVSGGRQSPDMAELGFLLHLVDMMDGVQELYSPGATFTILTEGAFYLENAQIFDVAEDEIQRYEETVQKFADGVSSGRIQLVPLQHIVRQAPSFVQRFEAERALSEADYGRYLPVMQRSMTARQRALGITPEAMARDYAALHRAKHLCGDQSGSAVYQYLEATLGSNFVYCSVTGSQRPEVFNIDTGRKPTLLPQHGIGVLQGGSSLIAVMPYADLLAHAKAHKIGGIVIEDLDPSPFGYIKFGTARNV